MKKQTADRPFSFLLMNEREIKPRTKGLTEIRGPYYTPMGINYLSDILETMGDYIDSLKFAGGSFTLIPGRELERIIKLAHEHDVLVSTGGFGCADWNRDDDGSRPPQVQCADRRLHTRARGQTIFG